MKFHSNIFGWEYVWRDFADSKGGKITSDSSKENDPIIKIEVPVEGTRAWITFVPATLKGKSRGTGTSASLVYPPSEDFAFSIRTEKGVDQIGKALGMQDIQLGDHDFDSRFLIQGTDVGKVRNLFADMHLRDLILNNGPSELRLHQEGDINSEHKVPAGKHAVVYNSERMLDKFEQLDDVYKVLASVVHRLGIIPALAGTEAHVQEEPVEDKGEGRKLHSPLLDMA